MNLQELEQLLRQGLEQQASAELTPEQVGVLSQDWQPSRPFQKRMARLKYQVRRRLPRWVTVAAAVVAVLVAFTLAASAIPSVRAYVQQVFRSLTGDGADVEYRFEDGKDGWDQPYRVKWNPDWLPEGYVETERREMFSTTVVIYETNVGGDDHIITIMYGTTDEGAVMSMDRLTHDVIEIPLRGVVAEFYQSILGDEDNMLFWIEKTEKDELLFFSLTGSLPQKALVHIAESLKPVP